MIKSKFTNLEKYNQNFLINEKVIEKIISFSDIKKTDIIVEIGAGKGNITKILAEKSAKVISFEIDNRLKEFLEELPENVHLIFEDGRNYLLNHPNLEYNKVISSPPYYLCEPLMHLFIRRTNVEKFVLVVPKNFEDKIRKNIIFSSFFNITKCFDIASTNFNPIPRVDSVLIILTHKREKESTNEEIIIKNLYFNEKLKLKNGLRNVIMLLLKKSNQLNTKNQARKIIESLNLTEPLKDKLIDKMSFEEYTLVAKKLISNSFIRQADTHE